MEKKNFSSFIINDYYDSKEIIIRYNELISMKNNVLSELKKYDRMNKEVFYNSLDFADIRALWSLVSRLNKYNQLYSAKLKNTGILDGINLANLEEKLYLKVNYRELKDNLRDFNQSIEFIVDENISFSSIGDSCCYHKFVEIDGTLRCVLCNGTTKDFELTEEEYNFLISIAKISGRYLGEIKESDIPLLEVLQQEWKDYFKYYKTPYEELTLEEQEDYYEEMALTNESIPSSIMKDITLAHELDSDKNKTLTSRPLFFSDYITQDEKEKLENELLEMKKQRFQLKGEEVDSISLLLWEYLVVMYEIQLLSGKSVVELYNDVNQEIQKDALVKAYYRVSNSSIRKNSEYYSETKEKRGIFACRTAHPEINQKILEMKKRNN